MARTKVLKTYKLFIGGAFPRSESGHCFPVKDAGKKSVVANVSRASRKDLREAVKSARGAFSGWSSKTAYNRGQILYRIAEMLESRSSEFVEQIVLVTGATRAKAEKEVQASVDRLIWYAGFSDKYQQIFGSANPVAQPYFNFTMPEPTGVVGLIASDDWSLLPLVSQIAPAIVSGNTVVAIVSEKYPTLAMTLAEVIETSDVPGGVVNILTSQKDELYSHLAKHMDVNAIQYVGKNKKVLKLLQEEGAENVKRIVCQYTPSANDWFLEKTQSPYWIQSFTEYKTTWHPIGI